jgi:DNA (cytosine-5)-methyltransferase 1
MTSTKTKRFRVGEEKRRDQPSVKYRLGELFSGPGGIACGAQMATVTDARDIVHSIEHVWSNDSDEASCETFRKNIEIDPAAVYCEDVKRFVRRFKDGELSDIDALAFGFPCNDFSNVGERKGLRGRFGPLYEYGAKALDHFRPKWFIAENVNGLSNSDDGKTLRSILKRLESAGPGYRLTQKLYRFENYGVPQSRHRIVIVGIRRDLALHFEPPPETHDSKTWVTAKKAIEGTRNASEFRNSELTAHAPRVIERLQHIRPGENAWNADLPKALQLNVRGAKLSQIYRRLDPNKPAYTLTGSGGGGTHVYHYSKDRALTNRERARLQTFPDEFVFCGTKEQIRKQVGMAVPPLGAKIIIEAILKTFGKS